MAGPGLERCTDPRYVDWDPEACPTAAADVFLSFHNYYWPVAVPKPADLGTPERQDRYLRACAEEARSLNFRPAECEALVPLETLAMCGVGSGKNPPCWEERFTTASVRHGSGEVVKYVRDDTMTPSDSVKGFRFWRRAGLAEMVLKQSLGVTSQITLPGFGSSSAALKALTGVSIALAQSKASQVLLYPPLSASPTQLEATSPQVAVHARSLAQLVADDVLHVPLAVYRLGTMAGKIVGSGVTKVPGVLPQDEDGAAGMCLSSALVVLAPVACLSCVPPPTAGSARSLPPLGAWCTSGCVHLLGPGSRICPDVNDERVPTRRVAPRAKVSDLPCRPCP